MLQLPDEYQDGDTVGSLVKARHCWLDLLDADARQRPQRFMFLFRSPTQQMALGLIDFLRYAEYAGYVRLTDRNQATAGDPWQVIGTTCATVCALPRLEHLFMSLRRAGSRYESTLVTLDRLPMSGRPLMNFHRSGKNHQTPIVRTHSLEENGG